MAMFLKILRRWAGQKGWEKLYLLLNDSQIEIFSLEQKCKINLILMSKTKNFLSKFESSTIHEASLDDLIKMT